MNGRELYGAICSGEPFDRLPIGGIGGWTEAVERWRAEGLGPDESPNEATGLANDDTAGLRLNLNMHPLYEIRVIEKGPRHVTLVDEYGVTKKMLRADFDRSEGRMARAGATSSMSHWMDFPVKDMRSWKAIFEERFRAQPEGRVGYAYEEEKTEARERSETRWVAHFSFPFGGLFSAVRQLMGLEGAVYAMADEPELVHTMVRDLAGFYADAYAMLVPELRLDQVTCFEDMCSNRAPLLSPAMFREFFAPGYRVYIGRLKDLGVKQVFIDTDGDARLIIPELVRCGFTGVSPCEIKAGMAPRPILETYPGLCCCGGIDKTAAARGGKALEEEFKARFTTAWRLGRYTPGLDHGFPPDISWESARLYAKLFLEWCERTPG
ncbi:MAG: uroporphyrinogen decarboxylase family protein [Planctomycetota bacterium]|jgi:uroporphyrinogen-III decarboxylase